MTLPQPGLTSLNPDSVQEFRVITSSFLPEFGRNTGAVIDIVSKRGTNDFHSDVYWFGRFDAVGARDYFNSLEKRDREAISQELLVLLQQATTFVTISEGTDRQQAAKDLATQLADYFDKYTWLNPTGLEIIFDEGIVADPMQYSRFLKESGRSVLGSITFRSVRSHESGLIQLADILAGFNRLATEIALGRPNKEIEVRDDRLENPVSLDLLNYIGLSLRWTTWGEVPLPPDPENPTFDGTWPFKHVGGFGLRLHSSIAPDITDAIYSSRIVYMGCLR